MDVATPEVAPPGESMPEIRELVVGPGLADRSLREAQVRERFGVTVVALRRADGEILPHPSPDAVLRAGDIVRVFGLPPQIVALGTAMEREGR